MADDKKVLSENNANEGINWGLWIASFVLPLLDIFSILFGKNLNQEIRILLDGVLFGDSYSMLLEH